MSENISAENYSWHKKYGIFVLYHKKTFQYIKAEDIKKKQGDVIFNRFTHWNCNMKSHCVEFGWEVL